MTCTYVFRIEDASTRHGPFSGNNGAREYSLARDWSTYPNPYDMPAAWDEDKVWPLHACAYNLHENSNSRFAFKHINGLQRWFGCPAGRAKLQARGFTLGIYRVPETDVVPGEDQCVFNVTKATHVADVSLTSDLSMAVTQAISLASD